MEDPFEALDLAIKQLPSAKDWYDRTHVFNLCNMGIQGFFDNPPWFDNEVTGIMITLPEKAPRCLHPGSGGLPVARIIRRR